MIRRRPLWCTAAASALAVAVMLTNTNNLSAQQEPQQEGPVVFGSKPKTNWLTLNNVSADFDALYRYQSNEIDPKPALGGTKTTFSENRFEETMTLYGDGSIYHPNLITLDPLSGTFGLFQDEIDSNGQTDHQNGTLYEWDVAATALKKEDFVPTIYSRRTRQLVNRTFGATLDSTITTTGAILDIRKKAIPTRIEVYHSDEEQTALDESGNFNLSQDAVVWHSEHRPSEQQVFTWDYTYSNVDQSTGDVRTAFNIHDATLAHSIDFGKTAQNNLSSTLHYFKQSGDLEAEQFRWDELLRLRHTDTFETHYEYTLDKNSYPGSDQTVNRGDVGFTHKLYKSLVTNGDIGLQDTAGTNANQLFFTNLSTDYHKEVPMGRLTGGAGIGYNTQNFEAQNAPTQVIDQPHTFIDGQPIILNGNNIEPNSIIITDTANLIVYVNGVDYTITTFPSFVQIDRVIGGRIQPGQTVLIDFRLTAQPASTVDTLYYYANLRYDIERGWFKGVGLYGRFANQDQSIESNSPTAFVDNSFTDLVVGADYQIWRMTVGAERQWHQSTIAPFNALRFFARLDAPINNETSFSLNSTYDIIDYTDDGNHIENWITSARLQHRFSKRLWGFITVLYQNQRETIGGTTNGLEEQLELQWRYRQTYLYGLLRNSNLDSDTTQNSFQFLEVGMRREF
jgi:hypothetical protein